MVSQRYNLNLIPSGIPVNVYVSQYDDASRELVFNLYDGEQLFDGTGVSAEIVGTKPDGTGFSYTATVSGSEVTATITKQMAAVAGTVTCEIKLSRNSGILGTANFNLVVEESALDENTTISDSEISSFEQLNAESLKNAGKAKTYADQAAASATAAANSVNSLKIVTTSTNSKTRIPSASLEYEDRQNIAKKASLDSPAFSGTPTAPTADTTVNNAQIATTEYVHAVHDPLESEYVTHRNEYEHVYKWNLTSEKLNANTDGNTIVMKAVGGCVMLSAFQTDFNSSYSGWQQIVTIPKGYRPEVNVAGACFIGSTASLFSIAPNSGALSVYNVNGIKKGNGLMLNAFWIFGTSD